VEDVDTQKLVESAISGISGISVIMLGEDYGDYIKWSDIEKNGKASAPPVTITPDDPFYLNYTSGSSGNSKGAITTHLNIYWNTASAVDALQLTPDDVHICMFAPFAHPHELFARSLFLGGTIVLVNTVYPKSIAEAITKNKVTCMMGLAPMYENLLELLEHHKGYDLSSLRVPESGGMFTRQELIERFKGKIGVPIVPVWGSTETTGIALANRPGSVQQPGSVGVPCKGYDVRIVDENGTDTAPGEVGEMIFRGPAVVKGYFEENTAESVCFKDGWYYSGDFGKTDESGNFYFVERKSGMMKVAGFKVYPAEIEQALLDHSGIREAAIVSVKDRLRGEVPKAIIVSKNGAISPIEIFKFCRLKLPHYKVPRIVEFRQSLPKTGSGKINKKLLQTEQT
jgi:acyl-coenzyme A synthetase/AMP-(fatty) acid ligase